MSSIHDTMDYGYDPTVPEPVPISAPRRPAMAPPSTLTVDPQFLPPVGKQTTPSCFVWSSTYGCATFAAAQAGNYQPTGANDQASPGYTYVKVLEMVDTPSGTCTGGQIVKCFDYLKQQGGTPTMATAGTPVGCGAVWDQYGTNTLPPDGRFAVECWSQVQVTGPDGIAYVRAVISLGIPLVYGTRLSTDFSSYKGTPSPYVGNGKIAKLPSGKPVGHCMVIIGYDDNAGGEGVGAVLIQNSFGTEWGTTWNGSGGFVWMAYETFQTLAQGGALYITDMAGIGG
jgi:hypothetical protein